MPAPYVHVDPATFQALAGGGDAALGADDDHHLRRVLRLEAGARLVVSDGEGREAAAALTDAGVRLDGQPRTHAAPTPRIHVLQALAKGRGVDEVVRAVTELGVAAITVVAAERSVVQLRGSKVAKARQRWEQIGRSAAAQARRPHVPDVTGPVAVTDLDAVPDGVTALVAHVGATTGLAHALNARPGGSEIRVAVGPEGGWTAAELAHLEGHGWHPVTLGSSVLRTEHAALVAAAATAALVGWMD